MFRMNSHNIECYIICDSTHNEISIYDGNVESITFLAGRGVYAMYAIIEGGEAYNISKGKLRI